MEKSMTLQTGVADILTIKAQGGRVPIFLLRAAIPRVGECRGEGVNFAPHWPMLLGCPR